MVANNKEVFVEAGDVSVSSRYFKTDTFLYYRLELS
jgi:hypothetical protein